MNEYIEKKQIFIKREMSDIQKKMWKERMEKVREKGRGKKIKDKILPSCLASI